MKGTYFFSSPLLSLQLFLALGLWLEMKMWDYYFIHNFNDKYSNNNNSIHTKNNLIEWFSTVWIKNCIWFGFVLCTTYDFSSIHLWIQHCNKIKKVLLLLQQEQVSFLSCWIAERDNIKQYIIKPRKNNNINNNNNNYYNPSNILPRVRLV